MPLPRIAFLTTCKGRTPHLKRTLPQNLTDNADYPNAVFVVLDYGSLDGLTEFVRDLRAVWQNLTVYHFSNTGAFHMAHAKNMAHRLGILEGADILVNMDADNFTGRGFAGYIARQFQENPNVFLWAKMLHDEGKLARGCNGRIVISKHAFLNTGGYDERFNTWSPDDKDFNLRLRRLGYDALEIERKYLDAILHNDKMRFREYQHVRVQNYEDFGAQVSSDGTTIVNYGRIGCGTVYRNFSGISTELRPLPTRIFGIGLHKTATTSLHAALKILGYDSAHWSNAHWAKRIWNEMNEGGRSHTLERHYALCDLPIPILFRELDTAYPGSKFILTVRSEANWIRSVRNHWAPEHNQFRNAWNKDPFTHKIHKIVYGQRGFDESLFLWRYRQHNTEVTEYFKQRHQDLLIMDMERGAGWRELCWFLERPVPDTQYPREFVME